MAIAVPSPLIQKLAEALGLDANRCRSIDLHLRTNDALTVSTVEYVDQQQADRVIKVMQSTEYVLVPKAEIERLRLTDEERQAVEWCLEMAILHATDCDDEIAALRGLLERTRNDRLPTSVMPRRKTAAPDVPSG